MDAVKWITLLANRIGLICLLYRHATFGESLHLRNGTSVESYEWSPSKPEDKSNHSEDGGIWGALQHLDSGNENRAILSNSSIAINNTHVQKTGVYLGLLSPFTCVMIVITASVVLMLGAILVYFYEQEISDFFSNLLHVLDTPIQCILNGLIVYGHMFRPV